MINDDLYKDIKGEGISTSKNGGQYVKNADFLKEIVKSKEKGKLTRTAAKMIILICSNLIKKMHYVNEEDGKDCLEFAIMDCLLYWDRFDPTKSNNPFAYFTSVASNGFAKGWRRLGYHDFPASIITRLDTGVIHSL